MEPARQTERKPDYPDIYANAERPNLRWHLKSAWRAFIGETFLKKYPPETGTARRLLNLGCGPRRFAGFVNADFYSTRIGRDRKGRRPDWMIDIRRPLKCRSDYWDGVFAEHIIEHLTPADALAGLAEILRTLKPGARLRVTVPSLKIFAEYYVSGDDSRLDNPTRAWKHRGEAIADLVHLWGHQSVWDFDTLSDLLQKAGYSGITECRFGEGMDADLIEDDPEKAWETLYVEAVKPG
jgi:predicted SAM-dependent methyltransferase